MHEAGDAANAMLADFAVELARWVCGHGKQADDRSQEGREIEDGAEGEAEGEVIREL